MYAHLNIETEIGEQYQVLCGESYGYQRELLISHEAEGVDCPVCLNLMNTNN